MLSRAITSPINWVLDNLMPPALRDSRVIMGPLFWILFGRRSHEFTTFKAAAPFLSAAEFRDWYSRTADLHIRRESDLTPGVLEHLLARLTGSSALDVGAGRGFLSRRLAERLRGPVVGVDIVAPARPSGPFARADGEALPFPDRAFDTVTCCHVLEHVQNAEAVIRELRRVTRQRLIVVVPRQREYRYTFDLHIRFFPYVESLQQLMRCPSAACQIVDNDIVYVEEVHGD